MLPPRLGSLDPWSLGTCPSSLNGEQLPSPWHALEFVLTSVPEHNVRPRDQSGDRLRDEHLAWSGQVAHSLGDCYRQATNVITTSLHVPGVHTGSQLQPQALRGRKDVGSTPKRPARGIEGCQESIACGFTS